MTRYSAQSFVDIVKALASQTTPEDRNKGERIAKKFLLDNESTVRSIATSGYYQPNLKLSDILKCFKDYEICLELAIKFRGIIFDAAELLKVAEELNPEIEAQFILDQHRFWNGERVDQKYDDSLSVSEMEESDQEEVSDMEASLQNDEKTTAKRTAQKELESNRPAKKVAFTDNTIFAENSKKAMMQEKQSTHHMVLRSRK